MEEIIKILTTDNEMIYNVIAYPLGLLEMFCLLVITKYIYKLKIDKPTAIKFILISTVIGITIRVFVPMPYNFIVNFICITAIIMLILKQSLFKAIIPFCIFLLSTALAEFIVTIFLSKILGLNLEIACNTPIIQFLCSIVIFLIIFVILNIVVTLKTNLNIPDSIDKKEKLKITINVLIAIIIVYPNLIFLILKDMQIPTYYIIYNLLCALILFCITTYNTHRFNKLEMTTRELETANLYNNTLSQLVDMNRGFKHDIGNMIQAIGGYVELNDLSGLKNYYQTGLLPEIEKANNLSLLNPDTINNPPIFGLLLAKHNYANNLNVTLKITSFFDYSSINMNIFDFVKIFGILLDNAIEASSMCEEKLVDVYISIDFYNRKQIFKISNTYNNKDVDLEKIFEKDYSTKENKSGFGLWEVNQIINKTTNVKISTYKDNKLLTQKLEIHF